MNFRIGLRLFIRFLPHGGLLFIDDITI